METDYTYIREYPRCDKPKKAPNLNMYEGPISSVKKEKATKVNRTKLSFREKVLQHPIM